MMTFRLSGRPQPARHDAARPQDDVFRRFFDLIERMERPKRPPAGAPETKARITRLDDAARRHS